MAKSSTNHGAEQQHVPEDVAEMLQRVLRGAFARPRHSDVTIPPLPSASVAIAVGRASILLAISYYVHSKLLTPVPEGTLYTYYTLDAIRQKVWQTDWVTPVILWTFLFGCFYLLNTRGITYRLLASAELSKEYTAVMGGKLAEVEAGIQNTRDPATLGYYGARLHALVVRWNADSDLPAVQALKNEILEIDEQSVADSFVPVGWCETALPLLGFLGTVIGIGAAIGSISEAIKVLLKAATSTGGAQLDTLFNKGFENMALAFDTTFFGLFFLLLLGIFHISVKKAFATRFDNARRFYSLALAQLPKGSTNVLVAEMSELSERVGAVEATLRAIDEESTAYKARVEAMVDHVIMEVPQLSAIRKALMKPVVQFARLEDGPSEAFEQFVQGRLRQTGWTIKSIGLTSEEEGGGMVSIGHGGSARSWTATFGAALNEGNRIDECDKGFLAIFPAPGLDAFIGLAHGRSGVELWIGRLTAQQTTAEPAVVGLPRHPAAAGPGKPVELRQIEVPVATDLPILPLGGGKVLFAVQSGSEREIHSLPIDPDSNPSRIISLPSGVVWKHWNASHSTGTVVVAGNPTSGGSRIEFIFLPRDGAERNVRPGARETGPPRQRAVMLPGTKDITQIQLVGPTQCVFTDRVGQLYYTDETRSEPLELKHADLPAKVEQVFSNEQGWLAVVANEKLSMWSCRRGGFIYPYDGIPLAISGASPSGFRVSANGRYLYGLAGTRIIRWSFPKAVGDQK